MDTSEFCIYTIVHGEALAEAEKHGNPVTYTENTRWVTGSEILRQSKREKKDMVVLFADAIP